MSDERPDSIPAAIPATTELMLTDNDDEHATLAQGAVRIARDELNAADEDGFNVEHATSLVTVEAACAWHATGLVPESLSERDIREICRAIVGRVAVVLVKVGWQPPARLLGVEHAPSEPVDGVYLAAENTRLVAELDAALGGEARARQECNELYEEISLLKRELTNAQQAYNRTFRRMVDIETQEAGQ